MSPWLRIAAWTVRCWVALYTLGLPAELRQQRRAELGSDIWEQTRSVSGQMSDFGTAFQIFTRALSGVPADLIWRAEMISGAARVAALTGADSVFSLPPTRHRSSWIDRNGWAVPTLLFVALISTMLWLSHTSRPTRLEVNFSAASGVSLLTPGELYFQSACCDHLNRPVWLHPVTDWPISLDNTTAQPASVALQGLERLPDGARFTLTLIAPEGERSLSGGVSEGEVRFYCYSENCQYLLLPPLHMTPARLKLDLRRAPAEGGPRSVPLHFEVMSGSQIQR